MPPDLNSQRKQELGSILSSLREREDTTYNTLLISVDFGTTHSGVSYAFTLTPGKIHRVEKWPGRDGTRVKVPTVIKYDNRQVKWGYEVETTDSKKIEGFKRLLDPSLSKPLHIAFQQVQKELTTQSKTPKDATKDFLGVLCNHSLAIIADEHANDYESIAEIKFVLSLPVDWPTEARRSILDALKSCNFSPVLEIPESEASAVSTFKQITLASLGLNVGDAITVCDAGGGSSSVVSYQIKRTSPLQLEQLTPRTEGTGSMMLNKRFEDSLKSSIGDEELFPYKKTPGYRKALKEFEENIKPKYSSSGPSTFKIQFPGASFTPDASCRLERNALTLTNNNVKSLFEPLLKEIETLVASQLTAVALKRRAANAQNAETIKAILLVGGLGASTHLKDHLTKTYPRIKIVQPNTAWHAVNNGSLLQFLPPPRTYAAIRPAAIVPVRKTTKHYGVLQSPAWDDAVHSFEDRYWDSWEGIWRASAMKWCIAKDEEISENRQIKLPFYKQCPPHPEEDEYPIIVEIKETGDKIAPNSGTDPSVRPNCVLNVPIDTIPRECFTRKTRHSDGQEYWDLFYEVLIQVGDGRISACIYIQDREYGPRQRVWEDDGGPVRLG